MVSAAFPRKLLVNDRDDKRFEMVRSRWRIPGVDEMRSLFNHGGEHAVVLSQMREFFLVIIHVLHYRTKRAAS